MALPIPSPLVFTVTTQKPELVTPAKPTPHEIKELSDMDDQKVLRCHLPAIMFYRNSPSLGGKRDPVKVIREALAQTLVFYYPLAGRLKEEGPDGKLIVECAGQGVWFVEADADIRFQDFVEAEALFPPYRFLNQILYDVPGSSEILSAPLLLIQVTRLRCGGFIFAFRCNHTMADGTGVFQFLMALAEMARGANAPFVQPVWQRELLNSRNPPRVTCTHHEYDDNVVNAESNIICAEDKVVFRNFFFGFKELHALRMLFPPHQRMCSTFDLLTACIWKYRIASLQLNPSEEVRLSFSSNARVYFKPPLPIGYYGNAVACPTALSTAGELSLEHALELVRKTKSLVTEEYMRSTIDLVVIKGRPFIKYEQAYFVSDVHKMKFSDVDFGWGNAVFGGPSLVGEMKGSYFVYFKNEMGEDGIVVPICLPPVAMERFILEVESIFKGDDSNN
ncbi:benzyl alcohol O-benzoyltransferase-like [Camellia sinensis]|nr:benzyl alcohol O-benzoyltransferase-like [Camellia sinensis]THG19836.1 hypothetical protein TEA_026680 [Camellia sinensis var. sinensis]